MKKLSFKEYLESKNQLLQAIEESPIQTISYDVTSYCKLIVGEREDKQHISLKPKQTIVIEWEYADINTTPDPISIRFENVKEVDSLEEYTTYWSGDKLKKWLGKNATEL